MATTTPNYGWPVPTDTDYVKDGAAAIEALGDAIDATVFALPQGVIVPIIPTSVAVGSGSGSFNATTGNVTFTGATAISLNGVFSATYNKYLIIATAGVTTSGANAKMRLRASGTDNTTFNYSNSIARTTSSGTFGAVSNDQNIDFIQGVMDFPISNGDFQNYLKIEILNPFQSLVTNGLIDFTITKGTAATIERRFGAFSFIPTTSFDGFTIYSTNALTGTLKVMAYA